MPLQLLRIAAVVFSFSGDQSPAPTAAECVRPILDELDLDAAIVGDGTPACNALAEEHAKHEIAVSAAKALVTAGGLKDATTSSLADLEEAATKSSAVAQTASGAVKTELLNLANCDSDQSGSCAAKTLVALNLARAWESSTLARILPSETAAGRDLQQKLQEVARTTRQQLERLFKTKKDDLLIAVAKCNVEHVAGTTTTACGDTAVLRAVGIELLRFDAAGRRAAGEQLKALGAGPVAAPIEELLDTTAKIAIKRAKRAALSAVHDVLEDRVCFAKAPDCTDPEGSPLFPNTCRLIKDNSLEALAKDPRRIQPALVGDLVGIVTTYGLPPKDAKQTAASADLLMHQAVALVMRVRGRQLPRPSHVDSEALLSAALALRTRATKSTTVLALEATAVYVARQGLTDIAALVDEIANGQPVVVRERAVEIALLAIRGLGLAREAAPGDEHDTWTAAVEAVVEIWLEEKSWSQDSKGKAVRKLVLAAADENVPAAVSAAAELLATHLGKDCQPAYLSTVGGGTRIAKSDREAVARCRSLEKTAALLSGIATYAATYASPGQGEKSEAELRAARAEALEDLVDAATKRSTRAGDWVFSLGIPVGLSTGMQWTSAGSIGDSRPDTEFMAPQLDLPLGFGVQKLVGGRHARGKARDRERADGRPVRWRWDGFHAFVSILDLGQFVAYRFTKSDPKADGKPIDPKASVQLSRARWDSLFGPGVQVAWAFGRPDHMFLLGGAFRYAPTLFSDTDEGAIDRNDVAGALRLGLFVAYYVSLFDFN